MASINLLLFIFINLLIIVKFLKKKGDFLKLPFWIAVMNCGWFAPMAIGGYFLESKFPYWSYSLSMFFASLCTLSVWHGFHFALKKKVYEKCWLQKTFNRKRLIVCVFCMMSFGLYFYWALWQLPKEMLLETQWTGMTVRYLFFSSVFKIGIICLLLIGFAKKHIDKKVLLLALPGILIMLDAIIMRGRRSVSAELLIFLLYPLWFTRRIVPPRSLIIIPILIGILFISDIGPYRNIMKQENVPFFKKIERVVTLEPISHMKKLAYSSGNEFKNYVYGFAVALDDSVYDYGLKHWNELIFNYVPAQIVGSELKNALLIDLGDSFQTTKVRYGHEQMLGAVATGYLDAFLSFSFFGFIKFWLIGWIAGRLYKYAMEGSFLAQMLYTLSIVPAMQSVSHTTNDFLVRGWIYFFIMGYPFLMLAKDGYYMKSKHGREGADVTKNVIVG